MQKTLLLSAVVLVTFGCSMMSPKEELDALNVIDPRRDLTKKDYMDMLEPKPDQAAVSVEKKRPPVPKLSDIVLTPKKPKIGVNKTVSISVTDDVELKDVLIELARVAEIDVEIDPGIEGGVILQIKDKPFDDVVDRIADLANLRYSVKNGILRIERDLPYVVNYPVNFLNVVRDNSGSIDVNANVLSADDSNSDALSTGSSNSITTSYSGDVWGTVEAGIQQIVDGEETPEGAGQAYVSMNPQTSMITVRTTQRNHDIVGDYLTRVKDFYASQVLIEAKIVEVQLDDRFRSGVDWSILDNTTAAASPIIKGARASSAFTGSTPIDDPTNNIFSFDFGRNNGDITGAVELAQSFGVTRTLSSPRVLSLNNQQSVLTFVRNEIFFTIELEEEEEDDDSGSTTNTVNIDSEAQSIPIGIIMNIQPLIDKETNEIIMNVRPTLSRTTGVRVEDPGTTIQAARLGVTDAVSSESTSRPQVEVREMDSVLRIKSGEIMVIGGMIEERVNNSENGIPYVSDIPFFGNAFKTVDRQTEVVQTIIFIKATIVPSYGVDETDQDFYNKFAPDPRPLTF